MSNSKSNKWNELFTTEAIIFMQTISDEEEDLINAFFESLSEGSYFEIKTLATNWHTYTEQGQVRLAFSKVGEFHASRFLLFMDYLSLKEVEDELDYDEKSE